MSGPRPMTGRFEGRIKSYYKEKDFGFIRSPEVLQRYGKDAFFDATQKGSFQVGHDVSFEVTENRYGMPRAKNLQVASSRRRVVQRREARRTAKRLQGQITSYSEEKGYGFIASPQAIQTYGKDVFLDRKQIGDFQIGHKVSFEVTENEYGMPRAKNLQASGVEPFSAASMGGFGFPGTGGSAFGGATGRRRQPGSNRGSGKGKSGGGNTGGGGGTSKPKGGVSFEEY